MTRILIVLASLMFAAPMSFAQVPATQPENLSGKSILVLPIEPPAGGSYGWVGRAIQQDMLVDLTQITHAHVIAPSGAHAADQDAALRAARDAGANYVVFGSAQSSGSQLRVTGQVLDASNGQSLATLKATAPADDLFPLEDAISIQVARALGASPAPVAASGQTTQPQQLPIVVNGQPYVSEVTPSPQYDSGPYTYGPYPYAYPGSYYPYYYPYYPYFGLGFVGTSVVITGHHFHDHDDHFNHGFDHRPFVSPHVNPGMFSHGSFGHTGFRPAPGFVGTGAHSGFSGARGGGFGGGGGAGGHSMGGGGRGR